MSLVIDNLGKRYGDTPVFSNVSLTVAPGEFIAIVGDSGVGKSSLLNCMAALDDWQTGSITQGGVSLGTLTEVQRALWRREHLGFVFQAFHVLPHLDVAQNVGLPLLLLQRPDPARVQAMLDAVGLNGLGQRLPAELSGGQLQRVAIARALVHRRAGDAGAARPGVRKRCVAGAGDAFGSGGGKGAAGAAPDHAGVAGYGVGAGACF